MHLFKLSILFLLHKSVKVFQRRQDGTEDFTRSWDEYSNGFGDKTGEFWLGNAILRRLTDVSGETWEMRVDLAAGNGNAPGYAVYQEFRIEGDTYILHVVGDIADLLYGKYRFFEV